MNKEKNKEIISGLLFGFYVAISCVLVATNLIYIFLIPDSELAFKTSIIYLTNIIFGVLYILIKNNCFGDKNE